MKNYLFSIDFGNRSEYYEIIAASQKEAHKVVFNSLDEFKQSFVESLECLASSVNFTLPKYDWQIKPKSLTENEMINWR